MKLQRSPERGLCLVASFAMALDVPAETLLQEIGDQWKLHAFSDLPVPYCWRGVHIQELIARAVARGIAVTPIQLAPFVDPPAVRHPHTGRPYSPVPVFYGGSSEETNWGLLKQTIVSCRGVLTGTLARHSPIIRGHAVAFDHGVIYDPDGDAYLYSVQQCETHNFYANCAWRFDRMEVSHGTKNEVVVAQTSTGDRTN